ncbi:uncharacterized protein LOC125667437 [Ostrea edulis]|uniref:uncharacterized protein LOC125667437 n=1 Tax=Ostrea edulis TaxID=37623 RepID=UPI0024AF75F3|nr:uncharacterized protein LOC125667437 [Ostrea edulis]XP_056009176.1 uncharacterized protein LOC125667437 [Ostrea edulis]
MTNPFWGPYMSNRQWGTVREDTSVDGNSWESFRFDDAGKSSYSNGEDGMFGFCTSDGKLMTRLGLWNHKDRIMKERLFGLSGIEGNHGEDMKELLYYLDGIPDHSYMKALYRYPQNEFPYDELLQLNMERNRSEPEFELTDTGIFDDNEYFDVLVEYGKDPKNERNLVCCYTITNHSDQPADLTVVPQFLSMGDCFYQDEKAGKKVYVKVYTGQEVKRRFLINVDCDRDVVQRQILLQWDKQFTDIICKGQEVSIGEDKYGCQMIMNITPRQTKQIFWSLFEESKEPALSPRDILDICRKNAEDFYTKLLPGDFSPEQKLVARQASAGLLWNKQLYFYNVNEWCKTLQDTLLGQYNGILPSSREKEDLKILMESPSFDLMRKRTDYGYVMDHKFQILKQQWLDKRKDNKTDLDILWRKEVWNHVNCHDVLAVPDKWEFPWFATWDTAFQMLPFARLDPQFAKHQLLLFLSERYMKADGQMPGCEWDMDLPFPPVYAWACYHVFARTGQTDIEFLDQCFQKLQLNFQWWLKSMQIKKDRYLFTGGFLGLDNISIVDRSLLLQRDKPLKQADATGWMAFFALSMLEIALVLSSEPGADHKYYRACAIYLERFISISEAMNISIDNGGLWHPHEKFYYDVIETASGDRIPIALRSLVGIIPALACLNINKSQLDSKSGKMVSKNLDTLLQKNSPFVSRNENGDYILCAVPMNRLQHILRHLTDEQEFLSPFGIRSLSKVYEMDPYILKVNEELQECLGLDDKLELKVTYTPAESDTAMFGGNSNWRGPVWLCMNFLIAEMLLKLDKFYGEAIMMHPPLSSTARSLSEMAEDICKRISSLFTVNEKSKTRPCHGNYEKYKVEKPWRDLVLFYEYFDSETGRGCGASHQTGWTALIVEFLHLIQHQDSKTMSDKFKSYCSAFDNASDFTAD